MTNTAIEISDNRSRQCQFLRIVQSSQFAKAFKVIPSEGRELEFASIAGDAHLLRFAWNQAGTKALAWLSGGNCLYEVNLPPQHGQRTLIKSEYPITGAGYINSPSSPYYGAPMISCLEIRNGVRERTAQVLSKNKWSYSQLGSETNTYQPKSRYEVKDFSLEDDQELKELEPFKHEIPSGNLDGRWVYLDIPDHEIYLWSYGGVNPNDELTGLGEVIRSISSPLIYRRDGKLEKLSFSKGAPAGISIYRLGNCLLLSTALNAYIIDLFNMHEIYETNSILPVKFWPAQ